jgi:hypothetical protein
MTTVAEVEMQQRISEFIIHVKEYYANKKDDFKIVSKRDNALLLCVNGEATLDFSV